jgi:DNA-binding transcriptional ArsR family regulator
MVEYRLSLDTTFASLADPTRRDILTRLQECSMNVSEIAEPYDMSLAAISKHLKILEHAKLIIKRRKGKERIVSLEPAAMIEAAEYLRGYEQQWIERFDRLDAYLKESKE